MKPDLPDLLSVIGLLLTAAGAAWIYPPAGLIVPGVVLFVMGVRLGSASAAGPKAKE
jgi:hypothetical protein